MDDGVVAFVEGRGGGVDTAGWDEAGAPTVRLDNDMLRVSSAFLHRARRQLLWSHASQQQAVVQRQMLR